VTRASRLGWAGGESSRQSAQGESGEEATIRRKRAQLSISAPIRLLIELVVPFAALLLVWALVTYAGLVDLMFLPTPGSVVVSFIDLASGAFIINHLVPSTLRATAAFALSVAIAFPLGTISGQVPSVEKLLHPLFGFTRYLPVASLVPLCILWFGVGDAQKIAVITIGVVFQLVLLLAYDSASVPIELIEAGRTFGLTRYQLLRRIVVPFAMPAIWDHLRISAGWAWSYLVLAELVAGNKGVGYFVVQSQRYLQTDKVFAGILFIGILGVITDLMFRLSAKKLFQWQ
jgi:NitT/TauT family transport system permease protein